MHIQHFEQRFGAGGKFNLLEIELTDLSLQLN